MNDNLLEVLQQLDVAQLSYGDWITVGMALKEEGYPLSVWDNWSRNDSRYHAGECEKHWASFNGASNPVKAGTIVQMAKDRGVWPPSWYGTDGCLAWDDVIDVDDEPAPAKTRTPSEDLILYLETLFNPDEYVNYVVQAFQDKDGRWKPSGDGYSDRTAGQLIEDLKKYPDALNDAIGDWTEEAGAWIRFNPMTANAKGTNDNVTRFAYALVESDHMAIGEQIEHYKRLQLPIAALVASAGKSVHAIVRIDAPDRPEYDRRVKFLYEFLEQHGVKGDWQNKNPSRLSRMPGVTRGGKMQKLLGVNMGRRSWKDWKEWADGESDDTPPIIRLSDVYGNPPPLAEEMISGVLRRGHKMLISSDSKSGKSFLLMNLALSIASGTPWLGFDVRKGRALYVNFEISSSSAIDRFINICKARGLPEQCTGDVEIWNLRGRACTLEEFVPRLLRKIKGDQLDTIIIDPIYKVIMGDENNASDMGAFCNQFDRICEATGCSCIYAHHHSKGAQGGKKAMDRASGSGVFARDPDAQLDISQLMMEPEQREALRPAGFVKATPWRLEGTLREFENFDPVDFWFTCPTYTIDANLKPFGIEGSLKAASMVAQFRRENASEDKYVTAWYDLREETGEEWIRASNIAQEIGTSSRTVRKYMIEHDDLFEMRFEQGCNVYRLKNAIL